MNSQQFHAKSTRAIRGRRYSTLLPVIASVLVLALIAGQLNSCSARYLPTRGDDSRKELIKQLLREIMDIPQQYEQPADQARFSTKHGFGSLYGPVPLPGSVSDASYLTKRSASVDQPLLLRQLETLESRPVASTQ